jgi:hypothetical protein
MAIDSSDTSPSGKISLRTWKMYCADTTVSRQRLPFGSGGLAVEGAMARFS